MARHGNYPTWRWSRRERGAIQVDPRPGPRCCCRSSRRRCSPAARRGRSARRSATRTRRRSSPRSRRKTGHPRPPESATGARRTRAAASAQWSTTCGGPARGWPPLGRSRDSGGPTSRSANNTSRPRASGRRPPADGSAPPLGRGAGSAAPGGKWCGERPLSLLSQPLDHSDMAQAVADGPPDCRRHGLAREVVPGAGNSTAHAAATEPTGQYVPDRWGHLPHDAGMPGDICCMRITKQAPHRCGPRGRYDASRSGAGRRDTMRGGDMREG